MIRRAPRVSIGLPVYNGERYLQAAIDSLLAQTVDDFHLVISDNASTDRTAEICRANAARDRRIAYVRQPSKVGVFRNFNLLVDHAVAPYFKWASADDLVAPTLLERCLRVIESDPTVVLVHSRAQSIGPNGEPAPFRDSSLHLMEPSPFERWKKLWAMLTYCNAQYGLMRVDALRRTPLLGAFAGADVCFLAELALHGKFFEVPEFLFFRRFHRDAASHLSAVNLMEHYGLKGKLALYYWRHLGENGKAIVRAPIGPWQKMRAVTLLGRRTIRHRRKLIQELGFLVCHLTGRPYPVLGSIRRPNPPDSSVAQ